MTIDFRGHSRRFSESIFVLMRSPVIGRCCGGGGSVIGLRLLLLNHQVQRDSAAAVHGLSLALYLTKSVAHLLS